MTPAAYGTLCDLIRSSLAVDRANAFLEREGRGWRSYSAREVLERAEAVAAALRVRGRATGDRIALIASNRVDWIVTSFGILLAGCVVVPIYPTQAPEQVRFILEHSGSKLAFFERPAMRARIAGAGSKIPPSVFFDEHPGEESLSQFETSGRAHLDVQRRDVVPGDLAVLMYTSGTTGEPKGVMLTHDNLAFTAQSSFRYAFGQLCRDDPVLSVLPFSHIYEHMVLYGYVFTGVSVRVCRSAEQLLGDLRDAQPVLVTAVPRIFERFLAGFEERAARGGRLKGRLANAALDIGRRFARYRVSGRRPPAWLALRYAIARRLVLRKIRPALGLDRLIAFVSGSAPLHLDTALTLLGADVAICEGYGPTECSPVVSVNSPKWNRYGTVGRVIPGVEVKIASDGEIFVKGRNVMRGYYRDEHATADAFEDGWYKTGDLGELDADGYLRITGRKNELFKTSGGKFVVPARVESAIRRSPYVNQVMVLGTARAHAGALIVPSWPALRSALHLDEATDSGQLAEREDVTKFVMREVRRQTRDLAPYEQVRAIAVLGTDLTVEGGELSPTLKIKRRVVEAKFAPLIERMYRN